VLNDVIAGGLTITHVDKSRQDQIPSLSEINTSKAATTRHDVAESDLPALKDLVHHLGELQLTRGVS